MRFPGRDSPALRLDAVIRPGEVVALTGPSGSGKSTALHVLLGFATPASGRVTIGGIPLADLDPEAWRARLAWVPQRPYLFATTIRDNITLGAPGDPSAAAILAGTEDLELRLGDEGTGLSAGQRQRVAVARAFFRDAPIVLLDEPTANLDAVTAGAVMGAIRRLGSGRTVIMAAHRPELIALADREISLSGVAV
ncbi:ATP-binding cassette domain-containing protein [Winogradskya humida]|uniref:ABC transporter domain-containing protein n=1 Tax=Winogradskya humida TaxID=113566 RepID=A0ABQ3ZJ09_9ACTN|nr:ABC transporter ATP-binding protein [Actinoplanes humidus]GIE18566.1 hypothetical protein Ahu01nite_016680 [Actinoplanes humidus]